MHTNTEETKAVKSSSTVGRYKDGWESNRVGEHCCYYKLKNARLTKLQQYLFFADEPVTGAVVCLKSTLIVSL